MAFALVSRLGLSSLAQSSQEPFRVFILEDQLAEISRTKLYVITMKSKSPINLSNIAQASLRLK